MTDKGYIYRICCLETDKSYIGSSVNAERRWAVHLAQLRHNNHGNIHLQRAFKKHGEEAFSFSIIETVEDVIFLLAREQCWIDRLKGKLYNLNPTAGSPFGYKHSVSTKKKHSKRMKGNTLRRGKIMPESGKALISASLQGNKYRKGIVHSQEIKKKISISLKKAYQEGRHRPTDKEISVKNLAAYNLKIQSGERESPVRKTERNIALLKIYSETKSFNKTAKILNMKYPAVWNIVKKYNQSGVNI